VKFHRANIMEKTDTKSLADLVRLAEKAKNRS
jgi:FixJ family two-component response regulator